MRSCQYIENETAANEGEVGGVAELIKMESPILFPASHFLFRSAAAGLTGGIDRQSERETRDIKPEQPSRIIIIFMSSRLLVQLISKRNSTS